LIRTVPKPFALTVILLLLLVFTFSFLTACGSQSPETANKSNGKSQTFKIGAIPDQNISTVTRRFDGFAAYLSEEIGLEVEFVPTSDYAALVTAFKRGEIHLAWFGGLTGVQARAAVPKSEAIAQRPRDEKFHSLFITQADLAVEKLQDLKGLSFTFGSESSTSGHLMPRYYLLEAGVDSEKDFDGEPNYSNSHDQTWQLVESGAFQAGALNEAVWEAALKEGKVDTSKVRAFYTTPAYYDYNWTINGNVDYLFGSGTRDKVREALLDMGSEQSEILDLFATDRFIPSNNENYEAIRQVAEELGIIK